MSTFADLTHFAVAIITANIGTLVLLWWKLSNEQRSIREKIEGHAAKLQHLEQYKADSETVMKLAELVAELDKLMINHHTDHKLHRTEDSEKRLEDLIRNFEMFSKENREAHDNILSKIESHLSKVGK